MRRSTLLFVSLTVIAGAPPASASDPATLLRPYVPAVSMEVDRRTTPDALVRRSGTAARFSASGVVRCDGAVGTAQLTLRSDLITTAGHVLIDGDGRPRAGCTFRSIAGGAAVAIDPRSIRSGSRTPMAEAATRDWAVARLTQPVRGAMPYGIAAAGTRPTGVSMVAAGNRRADAIGAESCSARGVLATSPEGVREIAIDCSADAGASGAALTVGRNVVAIYIGYRSTDPSRAQAFSATHYNFAISVDGPFRNALLSAAR